MERYNVSGSARRPVYVYTLLDKIKKETRFLIKGTNYDISKSDKDIPDEKFLENTYFITVKNRRFNLYVLIEMRYPEDLMVMRVFTETPHKVWKSPPFLSAVMKRYRKLLIKNYLFNTPNIRSVKKKGLLNAKEVKEVIMNIKGDEPIDSKKASELQRTRDLIQDRLASKELKRTDRKAYIKHLRTALEDPVSMDIMIDKIADDLLDARIDKLSGI